MKKSLPTWALIGSMLLSGCAATSSVPAPKPDSPDYPSYVAKLESDVKNDTRFAVALYLFSNRDYEDRIKVARSAYACASVVNERVDQGGTLLDVAVFAKSLIVDEVSEEDQVVVGLLLDYVTNLVKDKLDVELKITDPDKRIELGRKLVKAAAQAVMEATDAVTQQNSKTKNVNI